MYASITQGHSFPKVRLICDASFFIAKFKIYLFPQPTPLTHSLNQRVSDVFKEFRRGQCHEMG